MVRALPSDLARLVLDYLHSEGLQESYDVFLHESPHLEEIRNISSAAVGILPLGAKNLQVIVEEYYELISQDARKVKNANDALYKLWTRFDALLIQIKHHYKGSGAITTFTGELPSQSVRSRYSLNRLYHERFQMEREQAQQNANFTAIKKQQQQQQQQLQQQQHHQHQQQQQPQQLQPQLQQQVHQQTVPQSSVQYTTVESLPGNRPLGQRSGDNTVATPLSEQASQMLPCEKPSPPQDVSSMYLTCSLVRCFTCDFSFAQTDAVRFCLFFLCLLGTQSQFLTPSKSSQSHLQNEKIIGKSPKRKSAPPRRKLTSAMTEKTHTMTSTGVDSTFGPDEMRDLPSPWGSVVNNRELVEKLAENINKMLPSQESSPPMESLPGNEVNDSSPTAEENPGEQSTPVASGSQAIDDLLSGMMAENVLEEFVDMTSNDPAFNSLFSLFNTDRDRFLNNERKKLSLTPPDGEADMDSCVRPADGSVSFPGAMLSPNQNLSPLMDITSSHGQTATELLAEGGRAGTSASAGGSGSVMVTGSVEVTEAIGCEKLSGENDLFTISDSEQVSSLSVLDSSKFPNTVVTRSQPEACTNHQDMAGSIREKSNSVGKGAVSPRFSGTPQGLSSGRRHKTIVKTFADLKTGHHVRSLSFTSGQSPDRRLSRGKEGICDHGKPSSSSPSSTSCQERSVEVADGGRNDNSTGRRQHTNESTPSKVTTPCAVTRVYSPKEKVVARLLTTLPSTPPKVQIQSPMKMGLKAKKVVIIKTRRQDVAGKCAGGGGAGGGGVKVGGGDEATGSISRGDPSDKGVAAAHGKESLVNGGCESTPPGLTAVSVTSRVTVEERNSDEKSTKSAELAAHLASPANSTGTESIDGTDSTGSVNTPPDGSQDKITQKGVKRSRQSAEKVKASKKTKKGKLKKKDNFGFPLDLDVDKFLSQIDYES
ncbi:uncharacterized protein [Diadema setosum]|uniref:uncharacterized protein n=1 Tax=Diadema setosum TaxID=31175 RepID=UPI003B3B14A6